MKLTQAAIAKMAYEGRPPRGKDVRSDDDLAGFGVRVLPSGGKVFVFEYRTAARRQRYLTIGRYGELTLQQARELARKHSLAVRQGDDPQADRRRRRRGETVRDLADTFINDYARLRNKTWRKDRERLDNHVIPRLGSLKVAAVERADIAKLHAEIGREAPTTANRVLALLSSMWNRARLDLGILPQNHPNPTEGIRHFPEVKRKRYVKATEMPQLAAAIDQEGDHHIQALVWLYLFTGARKTELLTLRWDQVDLWVQPAGDQHGTITLPDTKSGEEQEIPLSSAAAEVLRRTWKVVGNPYVFPGHRRGRHLVNISKPWGRIRKAAGLDDVRLHDLRRTIGSWLKNSGHDLHLIQLALRHQHSSTTQIYARLEGEGIARAFNAGAEELKRAAQGSPPSAAARASSSDVEETSLPATQESSS